MLRDKNAIITGANRGIGRAVVEKMAENGADIWACARTYDEAFEMDMMEVSKKYRVNIKCVYFDLSSEDEIKAGMKSIVAEKKNIDILINNAGIPYGGLMLMTPINKLKEVFQINYFSQVLLMQLAAKYMIRQKSGCIINMASAGGIETNPGYLAYGSSKASLIWTTKTAAKELGAYGIRVNAVAPGLTDTSMGSFKEVDELNKVIDRTPLKRMAEPCEIADAVVFLASEKASFITGHIMQVDGGRI